MPRGDEIAVSEGIATGKARADMDATRGQGKQELERANDATPCAEETAGVTHAQETWTHG